MCAWPAKTPCIRHDKDSLPYSRLQLIMLRIERRWNQSLVNSFANRPTYFLQQFAQIGLHSPVPPHKLVYAPIAPYVFGSPGRAGTAPFGIC